MLETLFASLQVGDADAVGNRPKVTFANCTELDLRLGVPEKNWGVKNPVFFAMQDVLGHGPPSNPSFMAPSLFLGGKF